MTSDQTTRKIAPGLDVEAYTASALQINGVDKKLLKEMVREVGQHPGTLVLAGWSEYAKDLVNVFGIDGGVLAIAGIWITRISPQAQITYEPAHSRERHQGIEVADQAR
jgi:hypothetical protein